MADAKIIHIKGGAVPMGRKKKVIPTNVNITLSLFSIPWYVFFRSSIIQIPKVLICSHPANCL
ncbi:hypothetical protein MTBBW1_150014 [Desulfamplus magnetovallimortis]|uniref:Uncharacterized protein n=1 Tax=Desulfamplus magnetovallimortis TaxID=1246637 RepID=A0A1W1H8G0_9BACT|nr:hypothetical protein MTBBW1_150014 [Desulfamplus magnetovallimortis]